MYRYYFLRVLCCCSHLKGSCRADELSWKAAGTPSRSFFQKWFHSFIKKGSRTGTVSHARFFPQSVRFSTFGRTHQGDYTVGRSLRNSLWVWKTPLCTFFFNQKWNGNAHPSFPLFWLDWLFNQPLYFSLYGNFSPPFWKSHRRIIKK